MTVPSGSANSLFNSILEDALKNYAVPQWLGEHSPLASPYLLANHLPTGDSSPQARGKSLQTLLGKCIEQIQGSNSERYQTILRAYYVNGGSVASAGEMVGLAKNSFHLNRKAAIDALAEVVVSQLHPALRLERPPMAARLLERADAVNRCLEEVGNNAAVAIVGGSGIGKTAVAASIATRTESPTFWFTIRLGINDQLESLLFTLGLFCHEQGESALWQELIATHGRLGDEKALSMTRYALEAISPAPLLCFDDLDLLQPTVEPQHQQLLSFLDGLRGLTPQLFMAQRVPLDVDHFIQLEPLSLAAARELLLSRTSDEGANSGQLTQSQLSQSQLSQSQLAEYHKQTRGNPRLLHLCHTILQLGSTATELVSFLVDSPTVAALLSRILNQLGDIERGVLMALSVYRNPAPAYMWQSSERGPALVTLVQSHLVQDDGRGSLAVVPVYRALLYQNLPDEMRQQLHADAATVRRTIGAYTAAAYHAIEAGQIEEAVWLWRDVQQQEIEQGQAQAARTVFRPLLHTVKDSTTGEALAILCGNLERFLGNLAQAGEDLQATLFRTPILQVEAGDLAGVVANDQSEFAQAEELMHQSLNTAEALVESRIARIRKGLGWLHMRQRHYDQADQELTFAQYEIENLRGNIAFERCQYDAAETYYRRARTLAEDSGYREGIAKTATNLGSIYLFRGQFKACEQSLKLAFGIYQDMGKTMAMTGSQLTMAVARNQVGDHKNALALLQKAERLSPQSESAAWVRALITQARAEAYLGLSRLEEAERYAQQAIDLEEIDILPDAYRVYGEILTQRGELDAAHQALQHALSLAEEYADPYLCGYTWRALSQLYQKQDALDEAKHAKGQAIEAFTEINLPNEVEKTNQQQEPPHDH